MIEVGACRQAESLEQVLVLAVRENKCEFVRILLEQGVNASTIVNREKITPLHIAMQHECTDCIQNLISYGANVYMRDEQGLTPLHYGIVFGKGRGLEALLQIGVDPNVEWKTKGDVIHLAVQRNEPVSILIYGCFIGNSSYTYLFPR